MTRFPRLRRVLPWLLAVVVLLGGGGALAARLYLSSGRAAEQVRARLARILGGPVELDSVHIGLFGDSSLRGLRVYEGGGKTPHEPYLSVDEVQTDLSALDVVLGLATPGRLDLRGAHVTLELDREGNLRTRLPTFKGAEGKGPPRISLRDGRLTLRRDGRPTMDVGGVDARVTPHPGDGWKLEGSIDDSYWGSWGADAGLSSPGGDFELHLKTRAPVPVTRKKLEEIPYVPPHVWDEVKADGLAGADLTVTMRADGSDVRYRVDVQARRTKVYVSAIELSAHDASGEVIVEDGVVSLRGVRGRAAGGTITIPTAEMDFRGKGSHMDFRVRAQGVALRQLPATWKVPEGIEGQLNGDAHLHVVARDGKLSTDGSTGEGQIEGARLLGFPTREPIRLRLASHGGRLRFLTRSSVAQLLTTAALPSPGGPDLDPPGAPLSPWSPGGLAGELARRVGHAANRLATLSSAVAARLARIDRPAPPGREPTYLDISFALEDVDLDQLVNRLGLRLAFAVSGRLSVDVRAAVPVDSPRDLKLYRVRGTARLPRAEVAGFRMAGVRARVDYRDGVLRLEDLSGEVPPPAKGGKPGTFKGSARMEVEPVGRLTATLTVDDVPVESTFGRAADLPPQTGGAVSGTVRASVRADRLQHPSAWKGTASLRAPALEVYGVPVTGARADLAVAEGVATVSALKARLGKAPLSGSATLKLSGKFPYDARLRLGHADLALSRKLAPAFRPPVPVKGELDLTANLRGTLKPRTFTARGTAGASDLSVSGVKVDAVALKWLEEEGQLRLSDIRAKLYEGEVTGSATLPTAPDSTGKANLRIKGVAVQDLLRALPPLPVRLEGRVSGSVTGTLSASAAGKPRALDTDLSLEAPSMRVQGIPTQRLRGSVSHRAGVTEYRLTGESLGGKFRLEGKLPARGKPPAPPAPPGEGRFQLEGVSLRQLWRALDLGGQFRPPSGRLSIDLPYRHTGPGFEPTGRGRFEVRDLRWGERELADNVRGDVLVGGGLLQLRNINATVGGGILRAQVVYNLRDPSRGFFTLSLTGADAERVLAFSPDLAESVRGALDLSLRGNLGRVWRGSGTAVLTRGRVLGAEVEEWRVPLDFAFAPGLGYGQVEVRDSGAQVGQGRATARATIRWGGAGAEVRGNVRLLDANAGRLASVLDERRSSVQGRVNGRVDFSGTNVRSLDDLTATVQATLNQTQAFQLPVLAQVAPYLAPGQSNATFQSGELRARLARGVLRIERLTLAGSFLQMIVEGTVTLQGRLDLDVTARTATLGPDPLLLRILRLRVPAFGPLPLSMIVQASSYLSNRVIHLRVTGTVRNPVIRVEPIRLLTEEAARFFLNRALPPLR
jgi:translocation and assembly module TamB